MVVLDNKQSPDGRGQQSRGAARFFGRRPNLQTPTEALHPDTPPPPPTLRPNSKRRPMLSALSGIMSFLLIAAVLGIGILAYASSKLAEPGPLTADKVVFIAPRTEVSDIVDQLHKSGVISDPTVLKLTLVIDRKWSQVKAGEYLFKQHASLNDVIDTLVSGKAVLHSVTLPEGLTSEQIVERLRQNELLTGEILEIPPEGSLLPETYRVLRGQPRASVIRQMRDQQTRIVDQIWERKAADIPIRTKLELLTIASIIEKETGRADERTRVASVYYNRLRKGMKLQSDPTIVYGLVGGKGTLGRPIQRDEIMRPTRYNTYVIPALPPGPIANPGRASLEAAANPSRTSDVFFVANGTGGHTFAETLEQHNRNVLRWREIERERAAQRAQQPVGTPGDANQSTDRVAPDAEPDPAAAPANRGRRSDLPGGAMFGEVPAQLNVAPSALGNLAKALQAPGKLPPAIIASGEANPPVAKTPAASAVTAFAPLAQTAALPSSAPILPSSLTKASASEPQRTAAQSPPEAPAQAPAGTPKENEEAPAKYRLGKGIGELGIQISGVDPKPSLLDGPAEDNEPATQPNMETYPVGASRKNEINARSAMYGAGVAPKEPVETLPVSEGDAAAPAARPVVRRAFDASEGTALDPLRSKGWDLNATQNVPGPEPQRASARRK